METDRDKSEIIRLASIFVETNDIPTIIADHSTHELIFADERFCRLTGVSKDEVTKCGEAVYQQLIHPKDAALVRKVYAQMIKQIGEMKAAHPSKGAFSATIHFQLKNAQNEYVPVNVVFNVIRYTSAHEPLYSVIHLLNQQKFGQERFSITNFGKKETFYYSATCNGFVKLLRVELNEFEKEILRMTSNGQNETSIAKRLGVKLDLVRYYKKSIYKKYHINNMSEAVYIAIKQNIIQ